MSKKIIFIAAVLAILSLGCSFEFQKKETKDFRTGFNGLSMAFLKNTPPSKVFEFDTIPVLVRVANGGAYSIQNEAYLSLGIEKDYTKKATLLAGGRASPVEGVSSNANFGLDGKSAIRPSGDEEVISYTLDIGKIDPQSEQHTSTVIATLCYPYETVLSATACIDTDVNNLRYGEKICSLSNMIFSGGQGAPVAITMIEPQMVPLQPTAKDGVTDMVKPQFLIYVENKGSGIVIDRGKAKEFCTKSEAWHEDFNIIYIDTSLGNSKLKCDLEKKIGSPDLGHIKLKDNKDIIRCFLEEGVSRNSDPYLSPLKITLTYGYTQSISASYLIEKRAS